MERRDGPERIGVETPRRGVCTVGEAAVGDGAGRLPESVKEKSKSERPPSVSLPGGGRC